MKSLIGILILLATVSVAHADPTAGTNQPPTAYGQCWGYQPGTGGDFCLNDGSASFWQKYIGDVINDTRGTPQCSPTNTSLCGHLEVTGLQNHTFFGTPTDGQTFCYQASTQHFIPCTPGTGGGVNPGTQNQIGYYAAAGSVISGNINTTDSLGNMGVSGVLTVNNSQAVSNGPDIDILKDNIGSATIRFQTGNSSFPWRFQGTGYSGNSTQWQLSNGSNLLAECWAGTGVGSFFTNTCGFQQPSGGSPLHLIRVSDISPSGELISAESNGATTGGSGQEFWSIDANGFEHFWGSSSGNITIQPQAASGTYNLNLPTTAGSSGQVLTSAGGGSSPMTWSSVITTITGGTCAAGDVVSAVSSAGAVTCTQKTDPFVCGTIVAPTASQVLCDIPITKAETIPTSCTGSQAVSTATATGTATFTINKIHAGATTSAGTVAWSASGTTGAFTCASPTSFAAGDMLQVVAPSSPDATLAGLGITISMNAGAL